jgi:hypothetical protein
MDDRPIDLDLMLGSLGNGPGLLSGLMEKVPEDVRKLHRIPGKWCVHAHACHIVDVQPMLMERLKRFLAEASPAFAPFLPDGTDGETPLLAMDLREQMRRFPGLRAELLETIRSAPAGLWGKRASHPEYSAYTPEILVRHILMHDALHMYRIEELWLTRDEYLPKPRDK